MTARLTAFAAPPTGRENAGQGVIDRLNSKLVLAENGECWLWNDGLRAGRLGR